MTTALSAVVKVRDHEFTVMYDWIDDGQAPRAVPSSIYIGDHPDNIAPILSHLILVLIAEAAAVAHTEAQNYLARRIHMEEMKA